MKIQSISHRFSYAFIGVVTLILLAFATIAIFANMARIDTELEKRLDNNLKLSAISLPTPLWNLDSKIVGDFFEALFLDESAVFGEIMWGGNVISKRIRAKFKEKDASYFEQSSQYVICTFFKRVECWIVHQSPGLVFPILSECREDRHCCDRCAP